MSHTPRTDEHTRFVADYHGDRVTADFARQLEREGAALMETIEELRFALEHAVYRTHKGGCDSCDIIDRLLKRDKTPAVAANALLIAAAPEMLAALERIAAMTCDHGPQEFCPRTFAAETIDKATHAQ